MKPCHTCRHKALRPINGFALWGCTKKRLRFGNTADFKAGKWTGENGMKKEAKVADMPDECKEFEK